MLRSNACLRNSALQFAGDAVMVLWESDRVDRRHKQSLRDASICATQCGLAIHRRLHNFKVSVENQSLL
jgi:hypothetical protein